MEVSAMASEIDEQKNTDSTREPHEDQSVSREALEHEGEFDEKGAQTSEETGEEEPNPDLEAVGREVESESDCMHNDGKSNGNKDGKNETETEEEDEEKTKGSESSEETKEESRSDEAGSEEVMNNEEPANVGEEAKEKSEAEPLKVDKSEKVEETHEQEEQTEATKEARKEIKDKENKEAPKTKEKVTGKSEKAKAKSAFTPSSSASRVSMQASSRQRSARPSARRDAMAKFQQDQTPAVRNFKVQKVSGGMSAGATIKQKILQWCSNRTRNYEGVSIENFSSSWSDGLAFCALVHRFFPSAFEFSSLKACEREKNFTLAFSMAESLAGCCPLLDVEDMVLMGNKPDPFSVFTYVQSLCQHLSKIEQERREKEKQTKEERKPEEAENKGDKEGEETGDPDQEEKGEEQGEEKREEGANPDEDNKEKASPDEAGTEEGSTITMETLQTDNDSNREAAAEA